MSRSASSDLLLSPWLAEQALSPPSHGAGTPREGCAAGSRWRRRPRAGRRSLSDSSQSMIGVAVLQQRDARDHRQVGRPGLLRRVEDVQPSVHPGVGDQHHVRRRLGQRRRALTTGAGAPACESSSADADPDPDGLVAEPDDRRPACAAGRRGGAAAASRAERSAEACADRAVRGAPTCARGGTDLRSSGARPPRRGSPSGSRSSACGMESPRVLTLGCRDSTEWEGFACPRPSGG